MQLRGERFIPLQLCDVIMGAAGSYGNRIHEVRHPGYRGMSPRQRARHELAKHIYNKLRTLDSIERKTHAFNWFESTGGPRDWDDTLRIWKFRPRRYLLDRGWQNDHLGKAGEYKGPKIDTSKLYDAKGQLIDSTEA